MQSTIKLSDGDVSEVLVERILQGDRAAENEMVKKFNPRLYNSIYRASLDKHLTEDVVQDTWIITLQNIRSSKLKDNRKLCNYILRTGSYQLIMNYRARSKLNVCSGLELVTLEDDNPLPEIVMSNAQANRALLSLLANMKIERDKELLGRFYLLGDNKQELVRHFKLTPEHFDRVLHRARERFKVLWEKHANSDESY